MPLQQNFRQYLPTDAFPSSPADRRALAFPISQVSFSVDHSSAKPANIQHQVLKWIARRAGRPLPPEAWNGASFELEEIGAQHTEVCTLDAPNFWAARLDDADKQIPSRTWVTEAALAERENKTIVFGARLTAVIRGVETSFERSIPGFIRQIAINHDAYLDGRKLTDRAWLVASTDDVTSLVRLITDRRRSVDVIVVSTAEGSADPGTTVIDATDLARRTVGAAHVAVITSDASFALSDLLGRAYSVFRQAVRTYKPGFDANEDEPFAHPLGLPHRILQWPNGGPSAYSRLLLSQACIRTVTRPDLETSVPSFLTVKRAATHLRFEKARESGSTDAELLALYEKDNEALREEAKQLGETSDALLKIADEERVLAQQQYEQARETIRHLKLRIDILAQRQTAVAAPPIPTTLEDAQDWCSENLAGYVELHGRAYKGIKASEYSDPSMIYKALLLLRDHYVPMRREGSPEKLRSFEEKCRELGLEEEATGSESRAGEQGDEHYVRYGGRRRFLDRHLKKGTSREARFCFRAYFFWDEEAEQVVVGWLPSHLDTRIS